MSLNDSLYFYYNLLLLALHDNIIFMWLQCLAEFLTFTQYITYQDS